MTSPTAHFVIKALTVVAPPLVVITPVLALRSLLNAAKRPIQGIVVPVFCAVFLSCFFKYLPPLVEDVVNHANLPIDNIYLQHATSVSARFEVADLHCDALLWGSRDLLHTKTHPFVSDRPIGAVDLPRLISGNVRIQVFAAVNSIPRKMNFESNAPPSKLSDALFLKTVLERWPSRTWLSPKQRVLYQFQRLRQASESSNGQLALVRSSRDLNHTHGRVLAILAVEGLACLERELRTVDEFFDIGIRVLGATHFFDTEVGGSLSGVCNCGLTAFGRDVIGRMKDMNMIADLAHASHPLLSDILDLPDHERPAVMISHTGLQAVCKSRRNLPDEYMIRIAAAGGLIGIALFEPALCGGDIIGSFVQSVSHAARVLGDVNSIALGSDWDGGIQTSVSPKDTHVLASALIQVGNFSEADVQKIMFENALSFFRRSLPK